MAWRNVLLFAAAVGAIVTPNNVVPNRYIVEFEDGAVSRGPSCGVSHSAYTQ